MLKISQGVNNFSIYGKFFPKYETQVFMLQNAAKPGKLMEKYGNFGVLDLAQSDKFCLKSASKRIFIAKDECCKNTLMPVALGLG